MISYEDYLALARSRDGAERGQAAHFAASALAAHDGPTDEQAALYAAAMGFLDDPSVKVRAALAYGLLHSERAPRPLMLALLGDAPVIARAVAQYSPVLIDADLLVLLADGDGLMALAIAGRAAVGPRLARALLALNNSAVVLALLAREDIFLDAQSFIDLVERAGDDATLRGALLARRDLPALARAALVEQVRGALSDARMVRGAIAPRRLERLLRNAGDHATAEIADTEISLGRHDLVDHLVAEGGVSTRLMLHALVSGRVRFFAATIAKLVEMPDEKVVSILDRGGRASLAALFGRAGLGPALTDLLVRLIAHARETDLVDDLAARYFVVTVLIDELIIEHDGEIPAVLTEAFAYLNEQNVILARKAARGVMAGFAAEMETGRQMPITVSRGRALSGVA